MATDTVDWDADHTTQAITQVNGPNPPCPLCEWPRTKSSDGPARLAGAPTVPVGPRTAPVQPAWPPRMRCPPPSSGFHRLTGRRTMPLQEWLESTRLYWIADLESTTILSAYRECPLFLIFKSLYPGIHHPATESGAGPSNPRWGN